MFDLRSLEHSTIIYDDPEHSPLLRLAWNKQDDHYLATLKMDDQEVIILDHRNPCIPVSVLSAHDAELNGMAWAPHSSCHICTVSDDKKALIWDIQDIPKVGGTGRAPRRGSGGCFPSVPPPWRVCVMACMRVCVYA